jgi:hypothetical protein
MRKYRMHPAAISRAGLLIWGLVVLLIGSGAGGAGAQSLNDLGAIDSGATGPSIDNSITWDQIDREVDLTGLWGSIDPYLDAYPCLYTQPSDSTLFLVWSKWNGLFYEIVLASRPLGESWSLVEEIQPTPDSTFDNITPRLVTDADGRLNAVWTRVTGSGGVVYHAARFPAGWTSPTRLSGNENARHPIPRLESSRTLVDYRTPFEIVTVEVVVTVSAGGSDDIDPTNEGDVQVDHEELSRLMVQ